MCLRVMIFSQLPAGSGNVEVAQTDCRQIMCSDHKTDHLVDCQLRSSIGIGWARNCRLENWYLFRLPIDSGSRREDEAWYLCSTHSLQEIERAADVVAVVAPWLLDRLAYQGQRRKMQHTIESRCQHLLQQFFIEQIALDEASSLWHSLEVSLQEVIKNGDLVA